MFKRLTLFVVVFILMIGNTLADSDWKSRREAWEPLLGEKESISLINGGDLNGDLIEDVAVIYIDAPEKGLVVLMSKGKEFRKFKYKKEHPDGILESELAAAESMWIRDGKLEILAPLRVSRILTDVTTNESSAAIFEFRSNKIKLTKIVANFEVDETISHMWYDIDVGKLFLYWLATEETVGGRRGYYFRYWYRFFANRMRNVQIDCDDSEWVIFTYPVVVKNFPEGNAVSYGFNRWKSDFDLSAKVNVGYDEDNVYFYIRVFDDVFRQNNFGDKMLRGDHLELWFSNEDDYRVQIGVSPGNFKEIPAEALLWFKESRAKTGNKLDEVEVASRREEDGYCVEMRLPVEVLPPNYISEETGLFSFVISDSDKADKQEKILTSSSLTWGESYSLGEIIFRDLSQSRDLSVFETILRTSPKDYKTDVYLKNTKTGEENLFTVALAYVYDDHYHPSEYHNGSLFIIRRMGYDKEKGVLAENWTDELWKYDSEGEGIKLYSARGLDFRAAPGGRYIALLGDEKLSVINNDGKKMTQLTLEQMRGYQGETFEFREIQLLQWSHDSDSFFALAYPDTLYMIKTDDWSMDKYPTEMEYTDDYTLNPNTMELVYSDCPTAPLSAPLITPSLGLLPTRSPTVSHPNAGTLEPPLARSRSSLQRSIQQLPPGR